MTALSDKMRARAETDPENAGQLRDLAQALDDAAGGFCAEPQTVPVKTFMGHWARARLFWTKVSGEPLI